MPPKFYKRNYKSKGTSKINSLNLNTAKYLFIVESPSKCPKIENYLGSDYCCIASIGHIRSVDGLKSIDTKKSFIPTFNIISEKRGHIDEMRKIISKFSKNNIYIATDDDREGEAIGWHICMLFDLPIETTKRVIFHEVTKTAIIECLNNPTVINMDLVYAQHARQVLDIIVGYKISPILWKYLFNNKENSLSAGRCQTPALRLIYENHKDKKDELETKYKITGNFLSQQINFNLSNEIIDKEKVLEFLELSCNFKHMLSIDKPKLSTKTPPKPFHTSRLLQTASNVLNMSPKETMSLCQKLYQNGYITYMRTESSQYSKVFLDQAKDFLIKHYNNNKYIGDLNKIENKDNNNPHEAVRVTKLETRTLGNCDEPRMNTLYKLIWKNTIESCMSDASYNVSRIQITAPMEYKYTNSIEIPVFLGWKQIEEKSSLIDIQTSKSTELMSLKTIEKLNSPVEYNEITSELSVKNKHSHYTEANLIQTLETLEIGRPSTFATIVETIQERGYVTKKDIPGKLINCEEYTLKGNEITIEEKEKEFGKEKQKLVIEAVGIVTIEFLLKHYDELFNYEYTKNMENELDEISSGKTTNWSDICSSCYDEIKKLTKSIVNIEKQSYYIKDGYEYIFEKYGPAIKHTKEDGTIEYTPAKKDMNIDLDKLKNQEYSLDELIAINEKSIGEHEGHQIYIKDGKYGLYVDYNDKKISLKSLKKKIEAITLKDVLPIIQNELSNTKSVLRELNEYMNVRKGQYGAYVYYKKPGDKKPRFLNIKKCPHGYLNCSVDTLVDWLVETYKIEIPK